MELVEIDIGYLDQICSIENAVHLCPWSKTLVEAEFLKDISYRVGITKNSRLIAYSFNYIIDDEMHILNLAVDESEQRKGVGSFLLESLLLRAYTRGVRRVELEVRVSNSAAQKLYTGFGFEIVGCRKRYYQDTGEDALLLTYRMEDSTRLTSAKFLL